MAQHILAKDQLEIILSIVKESYNILLEGRQNNADEDTLKRYKEDDVIINESVLKPLKFKLNQMVGSETADIFHIITDNGAKILFCSYLNMWLTIRKAMRDAGDINYDDRLNLPMVKSVYISLMEYSIPLYREEQIRNGVLDIMQDVIDLMEDELEQVKKIY